MFSETQFTLLFFPCNIPPLCKILFLMVRRSTLLLFAQLIYKVKSLTVKTDVLLMGTLQTSSPTLVFDWQFELTKLQSERASCYIAFVPFSKMIWKAVCYSKFLLWLMMANIHYNRITRLKKGENNCPVHVWSIQNRHRSQKKLDYRLKLTVSKYWITVNSMCIYWDIIINATVAVPVAFI